MLFKTQLMAFKLTFSTAFALTLLEIIFALCKFAFSKLKTYQNSKNKIQLKQ